MSELRVWAPFVKSVELVGPSHRVRMAQEDGGWF